MLCEEFGLAHEASVVEFEARDSLQRWDERGSSMFMIYITTTTVQAQAQALGSRVNVVVPAMVLSICLPYTSLAE